MHINKFNDEKYPDPTAYKALTNITQAEKTAEKTDDFLTFDGYRPLIYICSPYSGNVRKNTENARKYSRFALERNAIPLTPHLLYPQFMDDNNPAERRLASRKINYVLLGKCEELWVFGGIISKGMAYEIATAQKHRQKIRYFTDELKEVVR